MTAPPNPLRTRSLGDDAGWEGEAGLPLPDRPNKLNHQQREGVLHMVPRMTVDELAHEFRDGLAEVKRRLSKLDEMEKEHKETQHILNELRADVRVLAQKVELTSKETSDRCTARADSAKSRIDRLEKGSISTLVLFAGAALALAWNRIVGDRP